MKQHWKRHQQRQGGAFSGQGPAKGRGQAAGNQGDLMEGVIQHHGRFAFMLAETEGGSDVFLRGKGLDLAMDGDRVQARVRREATGRFCGEIVSVLKRARTSIVGILKQFPRGWAVLPEKGEAPPAQVINFAPGVVPVAGSFAVLQVTRWPTAVMGAAGTVIEVLGGPDDVRARITSLLRARGINDNFPKEALEQSDAYGDKIDPSQWAGREELFHLPIVTIDGADAKDFDDAVSIEPQPGGLI
ncbi:MAG: hypothetical protein WCK76_15170, partial [Elusimicrobiota bacterium]